ncbi:MAG: peptide-methionine (S)-S-oxide reductase MsrA [Actinobacteria bacterium]|nr:peptide-methionine (S)-S-oxide reductase MsrA [Actinomycetota bacterium]
MAGDAYETIVLGGGCFWCTEAFFRTVAGVVTVTPGYAGGFVSNPTYREVCDGATGHAEVVEVGFDPREVSLEEILEVFFSTHDPTSLNRQGADVGTQYRSIILYTDEAQRDRVERFIDSIREGYERPIVTEVKRLERFFPAEEYHHRYYERNPDQPYCRAVIAPKLARLRGKKD